MVLEGVDAAAGVLEESDEPDELDSEPVEPDAEEPLLARLPWSFL